MSSDPTSAQDSATQDQLNRAQAFALAGKLAAPVKLGHYDELRDASGALRKPWQTFFSYLGEAGIAGLPQSSETIDRLIQQNGITYNAYGDQQGRQPAGARPKLCVSVNPLLRLGGASDEHECGQNEQTSSQGSPFLPTTSPLSLGVRSFAP